MELEPSAGQGTAAARRRASLKQWSPPGTDSWAVPPHWGLRPDWDSVWDVWAGPERRGGSDCWVITHPTHPHIRHWGLVGKHTPKLEPRPSDRRKIALIWPKFHSWKGKMLTDQFWVHSTLTLAEFNVITKKIKACIYICENYPCLQKETL